MDELTKQAIELVKGQTQLRSMSASEIAEMVSELSNKLHGIIGVPTQAAQAAQAMSAAVEPEAKDEVPAPIKLIMDPRKAIRNDCIYCCICGGKYKILSIKHLESHGVTTEEYRELCNYPNKHPLITRDLANSRRNKMKEMELWKRKSPPETLPENHEEISERMEATANQLIENRKKNRKKVGADGLVENLDLDQSVNS